jgi:hypothetical protein
LGRIAAQLPLMLVAALRTGFRRPELDSLVRSWSGRGALEITLASLSERASADHPLVRTVLADDLPPSARQALHGQIAQAFRKPVGAGAGGGTSPCCRLSAAASCPRVR